MPYFDLNARSEPIRDIDWSGPKLLNELIRIGDGTAMSPELRRSYDNDINVYRSQLTQRLARDVAAARERLKQTKDDLYEEASGLVALGEDVERDVAAGRLSAAGGRKQLAELSRIYKRNIARVEQVERDAQATDELAKTPAEDWQLALVSKYSALRRGLPACSEDLRKKAN